MPVVLPFSKPSSTLPRASNCTDMFMQLPIACVACGLLSWLLAVACDVALQAGGDELAEIVSAVLDRQDVLGCRRVRARELKFGIEPASAVVTDVGLTQQSCACASVGAVSGAAHEIRTGSIGVSFGASSGS